MVSILGELGQTFYIAKLTPIVVTTSKLSRMNQSQTH